MPAVAFDTLKFTKHLIQAGATLELAEATAEALKEVTEEGNLATKRDIERLDEKMDARFARLESTMDARFAQVDTRFEHMETDFGARIDALESKLDVRFAQTESKFDARFAQTESKFDARFAQTESKIDALEQRLLIKLGGMMAVAAAGIAALVKIL